MKILYSIIFLFSISAFSQNTDVDFFSNEEDELSFESIQVDQIEEDEPGPDLPSRAPINDYLPLLAVAAVGLGFYYRKELKQITK